MLVWSSGGRFAAWSVLGLLFGVIYALPMAVIALASFAGQWNGVLPSRFGLGNYAAVIDGSSGVGCG
jgi:2-aminoethylphosphonate transport system permease protein